MHDWSDLGVEIPEILLPERDANWQAWAVVACDQYSSQAAYWARAEKMAAGAPSTLHLTLPEVYLGMPSEQERIADAQESMRRYLSDGTLRALPKGAVLVERAKDGRTRSGLLLALDLERYSFAPDSKTAIRATEGTILDRIPPRLRIRADAALELPHILALIDDADMRAIEPIAAARDRYELLYDFDLMLSGGHVRGYFVPESELDGLRAALSALYDESAARYGSPLLFAVGDGNHSLATAKAHWDAVKQGLSEAEQRTHPARFALCEIQNIHDPGIVFEPIHRVLFGLPEGAEAAIAEKRRAYSGSHSLSLGALQNALDAYLAETPGVSIDYIHGAEAARQLGAAPDRMCFLLDTVDKNALFASVAQDGPLPRKAFSMGEADDKRYYIEARKIRP